MLLLVAGVVGGFKGGYWGDWWIWAALALILVMLVVMFTLGGGSYSALRKALGLRYREGFKLYPPPERGSPADVQAALAVLRPFVVIGAGGVALALFLWLMVAKPS